MCMLLLFQLASADLPPFCVHRPAPCHRKPEPRGNGGRGTRASDMDVDEQPWGAAARSGGGRAGSAAAAAAAADVEELVAMGFSAKQARDALEESSGDVEAAVEWLVANCM